MRIVPDALGEQQARHLLQPVKARNQPHRAFGVTGNAIGMGKA
jgi:hypothetical protein